MAGQDKLDCQAMGLRRGEIERRQEEPGQRRIARKEGSNQLENEGMREEMVLNREINGEGMLVKMDWEKIRAGGRTTREL